MNLYWPVYLKLEKEVLSLADAIHFSDDQISVYSIQIADLIVRCAVEIISNLKTNWVLRSFLWSFIKRICLSGAKTAVK